MIEYKKMKDLFSMISDLKMIAEKVIQDSKEENKNLIKIRKRDKALLLYLVRKLQGLYEELLDIDKALSDEEKSRIEDIYIGKISMISEMIEDMLEVDEKWML